MLFLRTFPIGPFLVSMAVMLVAFCFNSYNLHQRMSVPGVLYKSDEGYSAKTLRRHPAPCLSQGTAPLFNLRLLVILSHLVSYREASGDAHLAVRGWLHRRIVASPGESLDC